MFIVELQISNTWLRALMSLFGIFQHCQVSARGKPKSDVSARMFQVNIIKLFYTKQYIMGQCKGKPSKPIELDVNFKTRTPEQKVELISFMLNDALLSARTGQDFEVIFGKMIMSLPGRRAGLFMLSCTGKGDQHIWIPLFKPNTDCIMTSFWNNKTLIILNEDEIDKDGLPIETIVFKKLSERKRDLLIYNKQLETFVPWTFKP
jgi:hypothetical protein